MNGYCHPTLILIALCIVGIPLKAASRTIVLDLESTAPAGKLSVTQIPKKPAAFVIDEPAKLSFQQKADLDSLLSKAHAAPTYIVIKKGKLPVPAALYGNELLSRWTGGEKAFSAMVLQADSPIPETFVIIAGRNLDAPTRNDLLQLGNAALALIDEQPLQFADIRQIATALSEAINTFAQFSGESPFITANESSAGKQDTAMSSTPVTVTGQPVSITRHQGQTSQWDLLAARLDWSLIRILFITICAIILLIITIMVLRRIRRRRPLFFPVHEPRHRFSAPYSGGSNAQIKYVED